RRAMEQQQRAGGAGPAPAHQDLTDAGAGIVAPDHAWYRLHGRVRWRRVERIALEEGVYQGHFCGTAGRRRLNSHIWREIGRAVEMGGDRVADGGGEQGRRRDLAEGGQAVVGEGRLISAPVPGNGTEKIDELSVQLVRGGQLGHDAAVTVAPKP